MGLIKKFLFFAVVLAIVFVGITAYWAQQPITDQDQAAIEFSIKPGSSVRSTAQQIASAGVPINPLMLELLARMSGKSAKLKAGNYELKPATTPRKLIDQLVRGEFAQESLAIIEGWTFRQMRQAIAAHPALKHDTVQLPDKELLGKVAPDYTSSRKACFSQILICLPKGSSDLQIYKQAHAVMLKRLNESWTKRDPRLPYKTPYEALIMASIVEKETGKKSERDMIAGVFINRLKRGMLLQTDPTVIYGMGEQYKGKIRKRI